MTQYLWLLWIFPTLFVAAAVGNYATETLTDVKSWWAFPLYMTIVCPLIAATAGIIVFCLYKAAGIANG